MKLPLTWLSRHLDTRADAGAIADRLTALGLEVEGVHDLAAVYAPFRVVAVEAARAHPQADRLQICTVREADGQTHEVVCGAPNARAGMRAVFAPEGAALPGTGAVLKKAKIRGVESRGMLVSLAEMGLSDEAEGIIEAPESAALGTPLVEALGLPAGPVLDIALTPNRGDAACARGVARDLAAAGLGSLKPLSDDAPVPAAVPETAVKVVVEDADACPLFLAREIRGVRNGPSPEWLKALIEAAGGRSVSALVDITNFLTLDRGRPLHAYDAGALCGDTLTVRAAQARETIEALDGRTYATSGGEVVIADAAGPVALAGLIGGVRTGCTEGTTRVVLEAAVFAPAAVARAGRALGVESEARYRFERGVDAQATAAGMEAATRLILEICGGQAGPVVAAGAPPPPPPPVRFDPAFADALLGLVVDPARQADILRALGFSAEGGRATPPSWRHDIHGPADLAEEIARIVGLDAIPVTDLPRAHLTAAHQKSRAVAARGALVARGCDEAVTLSFMDGRAAPRFGPVIDAMRLENPIAGDLDTLRPSALPHLLAAAAASARRGHPDVALAEVGPAFTGGAPGEQEAVAACVRAGAATPRHWAQPARAPDAFDAKADVLAVLEALGVRAEAAQVSPGAPSDAYHPGRSGALKQGARTLAHFGEIHPALAAEIGLRGPAAMAEVFVDRVPAPRAKKGPPPPLTLPELQPVTRDFAFVVGADVETARLVRAVAGADRLVAAVAVFDVYAGLEGGTQKSVALAVTLQPRGKEALTEEALAAVSDKIVSAAAKATGAALRA
ncbi:MAG: phenylalanine--tRNA ligase subunit beta [Alphaproteobacteria bacterium]|jgi:phenylalanyl-tRNA synthetase beta chain|nr:phenylalanine--tRNA ligase subunit beta [Alphaproteobacteria bacterium]